MQEIKSFQDDTLELIAWREFGQVFGCVEEIIKLNPHLLHFELIPPGLTVLLPDRSPNFVSKVRKIGD